MGIIEIISIINDSFFIFKENDNINEEIIKAYSKW